MIRYEIVTTDGVFLALRYDREAAEKAKAEFAPRWTDSKREVVIKEVPIVLVRA